MRERLAIAALWGGLPTWTPETDAEIAEVGDLQRIIDQATERRAK